MVIGEKIHFKPLKNVTVHGYGIRPEKQVCFGDKLKSYFLKKIGKLRVVKF